MKIYTFKPKIGFLDLCPESFDDLWILRRLIKTNDLITAQTTRVIKQVGEHIRPNKGERIKVKICVKVQQINLDNVLDRLKVIGPIIETSDENVSKGAFHSLSITIDKRISIKKDQINDLEYKLLEKNKNKNNGFGIIAIDRREVALGILIDTHLHIYPKIDSNESGKHYSIKKSSNQTYFEEIAEQIKNFLNTAYPLFLCGPGNTKDLLHNYLLNKHNNLADSITPIQNIDLSGHDGIYITLKSPDFIQKIQNSKFFHAYTILNQIMKSIVDQVKNIALSFDDVNAATNLGSIKAVLLSNKIFEKKINEDLLITVLNKIELTGGSIIIVDSTTDIGLQVSSLGGIIALLRYPIYN